jgi:uncharacterized protein (TIGR02145 family)
VTVNPTPDLSNNPASKTICSATNTLVTLTSHVTGTDFTWTSSCNPAGSVTGFTANALPGVTSITDVLTNTTYAAATVTYVVTPHANGCAGSPVSYIVTVNPTPDVSNNPASKTICSATNASVTLTSNVSGTDFTWTSSCSPAGSVTGFTANALPGVTSITDVLTNTTYAPATVTYVVTPHASGCAGAPVSYVVTVNPTPDLSNNPASRTICSATNTAVTLTSNVIGADFTWTASCSPAGSVTGFTVTQATPVITISDNLTNTTNGIATVTYLVTPHANNCAGVPTSYVVTVNPKPTVIFPASPPNPQQVCSGAVFTPVPLQSNVTLSTITYAWIAQAFDPVNPTSGITGFTTPNSGNPIPGENITSSLLVPGVIKYSVTATFTSGGIGCPGDPFEYQVIVNPSPTVALTPSDPVGQTICSGLQSQIITFTPNVTPTTYTWLADQIVGVSGPILNGTSDNIPAMMLTTTGAAQGFVRYKVTPTYQGSGSFTCPGGVSYSTIFVNPLPSPSFTYTSPVCEYGTPITYQTSLVTGNSYLWDVTGAAGTSGGNTNQVTVSWGAAGTGTLRVQESINATGCVNYYPPITQNPVQITLQQRPVPTLTGPAAVCENSTGNLYLTDIGSNSNYTWLISGGTITSGGNGFPTATVTWTNPGTTNWIEVNYQNALGCPGFPPKRNTVEVNPLPVSTFTGSTSVCPQYPSPYLYTANAGPACSYTWSILPASYGTIANSSVSPASVNWNTTGNATMRLDAVTGFGCATFSTQPITINPLPVVSITPCFDVITNRSAQKFLLKGGRPLLTSTPMQGEYLVNPATPALTSDASGNYFFEPALVPGTNTTSFSISYRYTSSQFGCVATSPSSVSIMVYGANPSCGTSMTDYRDIPPTTYRTAFMGGKCWMAENLRYGSILYPITSHQTDNCQAEKYCLSTDANCTSYGGFYQWDELIQYGVTTGPAYQGVCPPGWHIPSAADFQALIDENQGNGIAGSFLKDMNLTPRGFEALFKGMAYLNTAWAFTATDYPSGTLFWTSTAGSGNRIITRGVNSVVLSVQYYEATKSDAFPVRCVRD